MPVIFQYGSNADAGRLRKRLGDVEDRGLAQTLGEWEIAFDVYSNTNGCAAADLVRSGSRRAIGVLYRISDAQFEKLRRIEGPRYEERLMRLLNKAGEEVEAMTFVVMPRHRQSGLWTSAAYVGHMVNGLRSHDAPEEYVRQVIDIALGTNREAAERADQESRLIESLRYPDASQP